STNRGRTWSQATNVTRTNGGQNAPPPGSLSERDITLAERVTYEDGHGCLHLFYELDHDAGAAATYEFEGVLTLNPMLYQRIPVDSIPLCPIGNPFWPALHVDSSGFPGRVIPLDTACYLSADPPPDPIPTSLALHQNFPNPFNASTTIPFELLCAGKISLRIFDVLGREIAVLCDDDARPAGAHSVSFDGSRFASGIYFCVLSTADKRVVRKMILLK
ncbi:MAG: T9SS type A sorting domain-containing protein, partial [bacterium]|nr:T9SS type A sorting domain-containing protein [bacterium]